MRAPKVCSRPGCIGDAVRDGTCIEHREAAWARSQRSKKVSGAYQRNRRRVLARARGRCLFCARPCKTVDHRLPVAWGGGDEVENLQPMCDEHHDQKTKQEAILGKLLARGDAGPADVAAHVDRWTPDVARYHTSGL